jgi:hypothetical protein
MLTTASPEKLYALIAQSQSLSLCITGLIRLFAFKAEEPNQPLCHHSQKTRGEQEWFDPHILETRDGTNSGIGVECRQNQMACE